MAGLALRYTDPDEQPQDLQMMLVENSTKKQSAEWLAALQKVCTKKYTVLHTLDYNNYYPLVRYVSGDQLSNFSTNSIGLLSF